MILRVSWTNCIRYIFEEVESVYELLAGYQIIADTLTPATQAFFSWRVFSNLKRKNRVDPKYTDTNYFIQYWE